MRVLCPLSGVILKDGRKIAEHDCAVVQPCRGGKSIYAQCFLHQVRVFVNHPLLVEEYLEDAKHGGQNRQITL